MTGVLIKKGEDVETHGEEGLGRGTKSGVMHKPRIARSPQKLEEAESVPPKPSEGAQPYPHLNLRRIHFYVLSFQVCGNLLWQP